MSNLERILSEVGLEKFEKMVADGEIPSLSPSQGNDTPKPKPQPVKKPEAKKPEPKKPESEPETKNEKP
jgi:hypothetical protein